MVAYQLLSGRLPYEANSLSELALKQQRESPPPLDQVNPEVPPELAYAVEIALSIDQAHRPADALLLADTLRNGAHGIAPLPEDSPTVHLGTRSATAATRLLPGERNPTAATRLVTSPAPAAPRTSPGRRPPAPAPATSRMPAGRPPGAYARPSAAAQRRRNRSGRRFLALLLVILLFVGVVAAAITISASTSNSVVRFRRVVSRDAQSAIHQVQNLVNQYSK